MLTWMRRLVRLRRVGCPLVTLVRTGAGSISPPCAHSTIKSPLCVAAIAILVHFIGVIKAVASQRVLLPLLLSWLPYSKHALDSRNRECARLAAAAAKLSARAP